MSQWCCCMKIHTERCQSRKVFYTEIIWAFADGCTQGECAQATNSQQPRRTDVAPFQTSSVRLAVRCLQWMTWKSLMNRAFVFWAWVMCTVYFFITLPFKYRPYCQFDGEERTKTQLYCCVLIKRLTSHPLTWALIDLLYYLSCNLLLLLCPLESHEMFMCW